MTGRARRSLGVCYYPEQWPRDMWADDAAEMAANGLSWVRIGEFAWSRVEPEPERFDWEWLDAAVDVLHDAGLKIIMGTPTATPPRWMLTKHPDMLAWDQEGRPRGFGSRRHYCFSHDGYREEARRIASLFAERYGTQVEAWQTDNEYDCHDTAISYSPAARTAFQDWCAQRYQSPDALNRAWGNVFWSMEYADFAEIDLPNLTVTEPNPAHVLAFRRFSSDQVVRFNRIQCDAIRAHSDAPIIHNFMGRITSFDHYDVSADLDIASWDSYPLGFLMDRSDAAPDFKARFVRQGDPDFQAFHHDLYRSCGALRTRGVAKDGRWWVMEQQPGPVNWAPWNPAPLPGMARLWAWEAFAHGAEAVLYFRWRQAPFAQEQQHAGLKRPDDAPAPGLAEAATVARELATLPAEAGTAQAEAALIFDYDSAYAWDAQPQGRDFDYFHLVYEAYRALRTAGLNIDILPADRPDYEGYKLILAPGLLSLDAAQVAVLSGSGAQVVVGPRSGLKTPELSIALPLGPGLPGLDAQVTHVESLPPSHPIPLPEGGAIWKWFEHLEGDAEVVETTIDGRPAVVAHGAFTYLAGWPDPAAMARIVSRAATAADLAPMTLPENLRVRDTATHRFWINYGTEAVEYDGRRIAAADVLWEARG
ncbi:MAG: beta-galactosidase [Pseudomonadota bacterium]